MANRTDHRSLPRDTGIASAMAHGHGNFDAVGIGWIGHPMLRFYRLLIRSPTLAVALLATPYAAAQQVIPPGQFFIAGSPFHCGNIPTLLYPGGGDIATATPGAININWPLYSQMTPAVQAFVYAHECSHHLHGPDENVADCWAVRIGRDQGFLDAFAIQQICQSVWISRGDWTHFPGPLRCRNMMACFTQP